MPALPQAQRKAAVLSLLDQSGDQEIADTLRRSALIVESKPVQRLLALAADHIELQADFIATQHRCLDELIAAAKGTGR